MQLLTKIKISTNAFKVLTETKNIKKSLIYIIRRNVMWNTAKDFDSIAKKNVAVSENVGMLLHVLLQEMQNVFLQYSLLNFLCEQNNPRQKLEEDSSIKMCFFYLMRC